MTSHLMEERDDTSSDTSVDCLVFYHLCRCYTTVFLGAYCCYDSTPCQRLVLKGVIGDEKHVVIKH